MPNFNRCAMMADYSLAYNATQKSWLSNNKIKTKCQAMTMEQKPSYREEISQCTCFALKNSRFCENHQNLHELTDEQLKNNTKICHQCRKHKYFSDMNNKICDDENFEKTHKNSDKF